MLLVIGDLIARVGNENTRNEACIAIHCTGQIDENGERILDFCDMNRLGVCNTIFAQNDIYKYIWVSPGKRTENKINQIMINKR